MPYKFDNKAIAGRLHALRQALGFKSRREMAEFLECPTDRYSRIESTGELSREIAAIIKRKVPSMTMDWLYFGDPLSYHAQHQVIDWPLALSTASQALNLARELRSIDKEVSEADLKLKVADLTIALAELKLMLTEAKSGAAEKDKEIARLRILHGRPLVCPNCNARYDALHTYTDD